MSGSNENVQSLVLEACRCIQHMRLLRPTVGIVLGSGLGPLAEQVVHPYAIPYEEIPGFSKTHASGHAGRLILGYIGGVPVVLMQGRNHRYEGHTIGELQFPIRVMHALGVETLIATNAAGGLNPRFEVGDLMMIDSHIDLLWPRGQLAPEPFVQPESASSGPIIPCRDNPYSPSLIRRIKRIALRKEIKLQQGCYLGTLGPTYETRSEYRFFRWAGADAVGMSTISEVLAAQGLGMKVLAFSVITNVASTDIPSMTTHDEVVRHGNSAGPRLLSIVQQFLEELSGQPD